MLCFWKNAAGKGCRCRIPLVIKKMAHGENGLGGKKRKRRNAEENINHSFSISVKG